MSKTKKATNDCVCTCDKCGLKTRSIPTTLHRRCLGVPPQEGGAVIKPKTEKIPSAERGVWVA